MVEKKPSGIGWADARLAKRTGKAGRFHERRARCLQAALEAASTSPELARPAKRRMRCMRSRPSRNRPASKRFRNAPGFD
ncbi:MAG: hypothetical protein D6771_08115 [Zetaproteobacteria bacterium]|nr:MAG: hypothetical protein D6771_08115 [Zetaproteobacteria bacterium]